MSIDMSQFYQVFFEESAEHLASMESLLVSLDLEAPDADQLNAIFRAAHSIKGGSSTFGFTDMAEVTHILETLLDRIRKNEIAITREMVDAFLEAGDVLHGLLEAHQNGNIADESASISVCAKLKRLSGNHAETSNQKENDAPRVPQRLSSHKAPGNPRPAKTGAAATAQSPSVQHVYQIEFAKTRTAFPSKAHLDNLIEDLGNLGKIKNKKITANTVALSLSTYASEADLREIFSFFLKPKQLKIKRTGDAARGRSTADQEYGFFDKPDAIRSDVENEQGYGFFKEPDAIRSDVENLQGYGFFKEPDAIRSDTENMLGYGFFDETRKQPLPPMPEAANQQEEITPHRRAEDIVPLRRATDNPATAFGGDTSIRVGVSKVDKMINLVGELVITQAMLAETVSSMDQVLHERLVNELAQLERNTRDLQDSVMSVRMMPINFVFSRFQRVVRDSAVKLNKKVQLKIIGEGTELDKGLIEKISDPLNHMVRNSLDHGIELPETRIARGKDPQGTITLRAAHQGGNIVIEVSDDGAGLNREWILATARKKGMQVSDGMSDNEVWQLIYAPGFSTATIVSDVSGRGVGMDVVKKNIESIGGRVEVVSHFGLGCTITVRLPLTLAILDGMSIAVGDQIYIIPLSFIIESFQPKAGDINGISGKQGQVVHVRGEYLPVIELHKIFNIQTKITDPTEGMLVMLETEGKKVALFVDELVGQHQVVIKSLETNYRKVDGVSGATIMGDGRVAMIMDVGALVKLAQQ
ncbi:MAG: chemotaxis protein CheW [Nitrosomonadales bacterium]|nr:chemotaxis protein CheW [Nitrosomonadales bacterium]